MQFTITKSPLTTGKSTARKRQGRLTQVHRDKTKYIRSEYNGRNDTHRTDEGDRDSG